MANFKGGFAFNNEAAKVEVEQAPDGTLISCVNPVTGESLAGGDNYVETFEGTLADLCEISAELWQSLPSEMILGNISINVDLDLTALSFGHAVVSLVAVKQFGSASICGLSSLVYAAGEVNGLFISMARTDGHLTAGTGAFFTSNTPTDMSPYYASIPTVTKIYHHPMPE